MIFTVSLHAHAFSPSSTDNFGPQQNNGRNVLNLGNTSNHPTNPII